LKLTVLPVDFLPERQPIGAIRNKRIPRVGVRQAFAHPKQPVGKSGVIGGRRVRSEAEPRAQPLQLGEQREGSHSAEHKADDEKAEQQANPATQADDFVFVAAGAHAHT